MKTLIIYGTKYGCTQKCAETLSKKLVGEVELCDVTSVSNFDLSRYSNIIIGGSVYIGKIQKAISELCKMNLEILSTKRLGLFICCMRDGDVAKQEIIDSYPKELLDRAVVSDYFGGEFMFDKMNFLDRMIAKKVSKMDKNISSIDEGRINEFAVLMNNSKK